MRAQGVKKRVTLAQVARQAGFSTATVSNVLNDRPGSRIPEPTAKRVRSVAAELGYAPDPTARGLRTGRSGTIGFISDEVTLTRYATAMIRGALDVGASRDYALIMAEYGDQPHGIAAAIETVRSRRIDGLLFGSMQARRSELPASAQDVPAVVVNGSAANLPAVLPDEYRAGHDAGEYLLRRGHRRIALIGRSPLHLDPSISITIGRRLAGLDEAMAQAGLSSSYEVGGARWEPDLGFAAAQQIFDDAAEVTAVVAANDRIAFGVYQAAASRGIDIPAGLSVISFDDEELASYLRPQVTTMRLPYLEMGRTAMELVIDELAGEAGAQSARSQSAGSLSTGSLSTGSEVLVPMPLIERDSVRQL